MARKPALPSSPPLPPCPGPGPDVVAPGHTSAYASDGNRFRWPHSAVSSSGFRSRAVSIRENSPGGIYWAVNFGPSGAVIGRADPARLIASRFSGLIARAFIPARCCFERAPRPWPLPLRRRRPRRPFWRSSAFLVGGADAGHRSAAPRGARGPMLAHGPAPGRLFGAMTIAFALAQAPGGGYPDELESSRLDAEGQMTLFAAWCGDPSGAGALRAEQWAGNPVWGRGLGAISLSKNRPRFANGRSRAFPAPRAGPLRQYAPCGDAPARIGVPSAADYSALQGARCVSE